MALTEYTYDVTEDCPDGKVNTYSLGVAIQGSDIETALDRIDTSGGSSVGGVQTGGDMSIWFKAALSTGDETILNGLVANAPNTPTEGVDKVEMTTSDGLPLKVDADNRFITGVESPSGSEGTKATHNFCDPCTWFQNSVRETEVSCTDSGDGKTWSTGKENLIDMYHGRVLDERTWRNPTWCPQAPSHKYEVVVEVNSGSGWVEKTMQDPNTTLDDDESTDGDYVVDYENGDIIFHEDQSGNSVRATFSRCSTDEYASVWKLYPNAGYSLSILFAEMQFSLDVALKDTLFQRVVIPNYPEPGDVTDVAAPSVYMRLAQAIAEAAKNSTQIPAIDASNPRGVSAYQQFQFRYSRRKQFDASDGVQLWIGLERDKPLTGSEMSITFHFAVDQE